MFIDESLDPSVEMGGRDCIDGGLRPDDGWKRSSALKIPTNLIDDAMWPVVHPEDAVLSYQ